MTMCAAALIFKDINIISSSLFKPVWYAASSASNSSTFWNCHFLSLLSFLSSSLYILFIFTTSFRALYHWSQFFASCNIESHCSFKKLMPSVKSPCLNNIALNNKAVDIDLWDLYHIFNYSYYFSDDSEDDVCGDNNSYLIDCHYFLLFVSNHLSIWLMSSEI